MKLSWAFENGLCYSCLLFGDLLFFLLFKCRIMTQEFISIIYQILKLGEVAFNSGRLVAVWPAARS